MKGGNWMFITFLQEVCQEISDDPSVKNSEVVSISGVTSANDSPAPNIHRPISYLPSYYLLNSGTVYDRYWGTSCTAVTEEKTGCL